MNILHINSIWWRTWSAKLCEIIVDGLALHFIDSKVIVGYDFSQWKTWVTPVFSAKNNLFYTYMYKLFVWLNFVFDYMRPWSLNYDVLSNNTSYQECDIIHIHCPEWGYFNWKDLPKICKEKKVVMILGDRIYSWIDPTNYFFRKTKNSFNKRMRILSHLDINHVAISNRSANKAKKFCWFENITTIYNWINPVYVQWTKDDSRKYLDLPQDKKIIISIAWSGSKSSLKWIHYVEKIIKEYEKSEEYLFISLWNWKEIKSQNYWQLWLIPHEQMDHYFNSADCFLYPSLADNCPLVVLESLKWNCPVVTFDVGWIPELMQHQKDWYIAKFKDYKDLLQWFRRVLQHADKLIVKLNPKFTQETMIEQYVTLYKSLL